MAIRLERALTTRLLGGDRVPGWHRNWSPLSAGASEAVKPEPRARVDLDYIVAERTIRLRSYDMLNPSSREAFRRFVDRAEELEQAGALTVETMAYFADFVDRFVKTEYSFSRDGGELVVALSNRRASRASASPCRPAAWPKPFQSPPASPTCGTRAATTSSR